MPDRTVDVVAEKFHHAECPRWHRGHLYFSDMQGDRVYRIERDGRLTTFCEIAEPGGLGFMPDGDLLIVSMSDCRIFRLHDRALTVHADLRSSCRRLNDMVVDIAGRAYVGDIGLTAAEQFANPKDPRRLQPMALYRVDPDGSIRVAADGLICPNGMVITSDGSTLIVAETFAFRLSAFDIEADGALSGRRTWAKFRSEPPATMDDVSKGDAMQPDGLAVDADGAVWMGDARGPGISRIAEGGQILDHVSVPGGGAVFACALGGDDRTTLYLTGGGPGMSSLLSKAFDRRVERRYSVFSCQVEVPGAGWP
jgi:sugar lactone lactonase YvrE